MGTGSRTRIPLVQKQGLTAMPGKATPLIGWVSGTAGVVLLYAAYKNKGPLSLVQQTLGVGTAAPIQSRFGGGSSPTATTNPGSADSSGFQQDAQAASKYGAFITFGHGTMMLREQAARSFNQVEAKFGRSIPLTGASRTLSAQIAGFNRSPGTFLNPAEGTSLHVKGIAVDVSPNVFGGWDNPALVNAFTSEGWHRAGKKVGGRPEPWHWSYQEAG